jgi:hypothetical protein
MSRPSFTFSDQGEAIVRRLVRRQLQRLVDERKESRGYVLAVAAVWEELMKAERPEHHVGAPALRERVEAYQPAPAAED